MEKENLITDDQTVDKDNEPVSITQEQANELIEKAKQDAINSTKAQMEKELKEQLEIEKAEAAKLAKLSADERAKVKLEKEKAELEKQIKEYKIKELENQKLIELSNKGFNADALRFINGDTAETALESINAFETFINAIVEKKVTERMQKSNVPSKVNNVEINPNMTLKDRINSLFQA